MSAEIRNGEYSTKSLFTAVLYSNAPEYSALSPTGEGSTYLKQIRREHLARASMEELTAHIPDSQNVMPVTKVVQLAERVRRAYSEANGNPADGRWTFVSDLLRLHCTRGGRRWIGTNIGLEAPVVPEHLCIIPKTSDEWNRLERKRKEEEDVKSRVQRWITTAEFDVLTPATTIVPESTVNEQIPFTQASLSVSQRPIQTKQTRLKAAYDPAESSNNFGFSVVKRSHAIGKGKAKFVASQPSSPHAHPLPEHSQSDPTSAEFPGVSVPSFLSPSFLSSQIQTSTPNAGRPLEAQDQPPTSSKLFPSTTNNAVELHPAVDNESLPAAHVFESPHSRTSRPRKRIRSPSQGESEPMIKRARTSHEPDDLFSVLPRRNANVEDMPLTPPQKNLPRLTDLIASAKCQKLAPRKTSHHSKSPHPPMEAVTEPTANPKPMTNHDDPKENTKEPAPSIEPALRPPNPNPDSGNHPHDLVAGDRVDAPVVRVEAQSTLTREVDALHPEKIPEKSFENHRVNTEKPSSFPASRQPEMLLMEEQEVMVVQESRPQTPDPLGSPTSDLFRAPLIDLDSLRANLEATSYNLYGLDNLDNPSPAKSLSSLAGSDSESASDEDDGDKPAETFAASLDLRFVGHEFDPRFTSTQKFGLEPVKGVMRNLLPPDWPSDKIPSTSQLQAEVNSQVDEFDKFMEADLGCDPVAP